MLTPAQAQGGCQVVGFSNFVLCASDVFPDFSNKI